MKEANNYGEGQPVTRPLAYDLISIRRYVVELFQRLKRSGRTDIDVMPISAKRLNRDSLVKLVIIYKSSGAFLRRLFCKSNSNSVPLAARRRRCSHWRQIANLTMRSFGPFSCFGGYILASVRLAL